MGSFGFVASMVQLDVLRAIQGVACGRVWGGALTWVIAATPRGRRGELLGSVMAAALFGTLLGPVLGIGALAAGTRLSFTLIGVASLGLAAWVLSYPEPARGERSARTPIGEL